MNTKQISLILGSAAFIAGSVSAQNLIVNGDFETGLSGGGYSSYTNEIGNFSNGTITNTSNWVLSTNGYAGTQAEFRDLSPPDNIGWGVRMGQYTDSYVTNTSILTLAAGDYLFSADHFGQPVGATGSSFGAILLGVNATSGTDLSIGTFTDTIVGTAQTHSVTFTLATAGEYQFKLTGNDDVAVLDRAWIDNVSLITAVPEPSSAALMIGLSSLGLAMCRRRKLAKS